MSMHPESITKLKQEFPHLFIKPVIDSSAWIAPGAQVMGDVHIGKDSGIWFNCVLRGDVNYIRIGSRTNIQDLTMIHESWHKSPTIIGDSVTIGHNCCIHACKIGNFSLIGMGSTVLDDAEIGDYVLLGAGSLVTQGSKIPSRSLVFGRPAKVIRALTEEEIKGLEFSAEHYVKLATVFRSSDDWKMTGISNLSG